MIKDTRYDLSKYFALPNPGLLAYFGRVARGSSDVIRTPFWSGQSPSSVVDRWDQIFSRLDADNKMPGLERFELGHRDKIGPLSVMKPLQERIDSIELYYSAIKLKSRPIEPEAIRRVMTSLKSINVRPQSVRNTVKQMRLSTNSGAPYFTKRKTALGKTLSNNLDDSAWIQGFSDPLPAVLGWRGQEGGPSAEDVKQRVVWMFPFSVNIHELSLYQPLIAQWQLHNINSAYISMRAVEMKITRLFDTKGDDYCIVTDFSKFDQHFNSDLQKAAYEIIASQTHDAEQWLNTIFPIKYNIPLVCSADLIYYGPHGMGSGSGGTNFDECCAHSAMQQEVALLQGKRLNPYSNAYGDDGYLSYPGIDIDHVISAYTSHGQEMNPDKQYVDKFSAVYLRRYFHTKYRDKAGIMLGVYSTFRALGRLLYQERYINFDDNEVEYAKYVTLRAWAILENCSSSPVFEQFVDFVIDGDKFRLGLAIPGFIDGFLKQDVVKLNEKMPDILGYTKMLQMGINSDNNAQQYVEGITNWRIYKYLRSKQIAS